MRDKLQTEDQPQVWLASGTDAPSGASAASRRLLEL